MRKQYLTLLSFFIAITGFTQTGTFAGDWLGKINVGIELRLVFHFKQAGEKYITTLDSPDQSTFGIPCDSTNASNNQIQVFIKNINASYTGKLVNDSTIEGNFVQGNSIPLTLKRTSLKIENKRPQEPKPPFPYRSEDVEYDNADKSLHYGATFTSPDGNGPFPAVVLITGSGPQNRNEALMGHKPFLVLADALTKNGFAVLRVDDRGVGKSTGNFNIATTADFAKDVSASTDYLLSRPEVNKKKVGLIGHSEGGMIAPMVATSRNDIAFVVLLAGPGIKIDKLMAEQNAAILRSSGISEQSIKAYLPLYEILAQTIISNTDSSMAIKSGLNAIDKWMKVTDTTAIRELGMSVESDRVSMTRALQKAYSTNWFRYFLAFDPQPYLRKLNGKVLALNGDKDIQVIASSNLAGIESALKKSKVKNYQVKSLPGLNHLFQHCTACTVNEYSQIEETFSPDALKEITNWLNKEIK